MSNENMKVNVGNTVKYNNGPYKNQEGIVKKITGNYLTIVENGPEMELLAAGCAVGATIHKNQLIQS